jgi:hypothetical protein
VITEPFVALEIMRIVGVLAAVELDGHFSFPADEIDDVWPYRFLPNKFMAIERS